jgi:hypothetical protein
MENLRHDSGLALVLTRQKITSVVEPHWLSVHRPDQNATSRLQDSISLDSLPNQKAATMQRMTRQFKRIRSFFEKGKSLTSAGKIAFLSFQNARQENGTN